MKLYIVSSYLFETCMEHLNIIYHNKNLYINGDIHVLFINPGSFTLNFKDDYNLTIDKKDLDYNGYKISKSYIDTINYMMTNNYDFVKIILPNIDSYKLLEYLILDILKIKNYKYIVENRFDGFEYDEFKKLFSEESGLDKEFTNLNNINVIKKELIKLNLNKLVRNFFRQKTTEKNSIDLLYLFIDQYFRDLKSNLIVRVFDRYNNIHHGYRLIDHILNKKRRLVTTVHNLYMYLDNFDDVNLYVNSYSFFKKLNNNSIVEYSIEKDEDVYKYRFIVDNKIEDVRYVERSNKKLCEIYHYLNGMFPYTYILNKLLLFYDLVEMDKNDEIIYYKQLPFNFNIIEYYNNIIKIKDKDILVKELNTVIDKFKKVYKFEAKPIYNCPFCIDGKIYSNENTFFCDTCDFIFLKNNVIKKYKDLNSAIRKREFRLLLKHGYITFNYNGENRVFKLQKNGKWGNLIMLRKNSI